MITKTEIILIILSIQLVCIEFFWMKAEKRSAYLQGQQDLYQMWQSPDPDSAPYVTVPKRHK